MTESNKIEYTPMQALIRLISAGARRECINDLQVDWFNVMPLAAEQNALALVACALMHSPEMECPAELREHLMNIMRNESSINLIRQQRIMQLLAEMKKAGIDARVLKGYAVSECYAHPECRGSVDTDLLIDIRQEKQAVRLFEELGFRVEPRIATSQHTICQHKKYGMVELHVALYDEIIRDIWLHEFREEELVKEEPIPIRDTDGVAQTMGHTDMLLFLSIHMAKHFILGGLTLRMMLDIALFFSCHRQEIDAARYWTILEKLHYKSLLNGILWNMIRFGGFCAEEFPGLGDESIPQMQLVLSDLERGGYMGVKGKEDRLDSGMEYNRLLMRKQQSAWQYCLRMVRLKIKSATKYMCPTMKILHELYPVSKRIPVLLPFLWLWQFVSYPIRKIRSGALKRDVRSEKSRMSGEAQQRISMFKELDML